MLKESNKTGPNPSMAFEDPSETENEGQLKENARKQVEDVLNGVGERPERGLNRFTVMVLFTAVLGGSTFGLDIGTTAITSMNPFRNEMGIPELQPNQPDPPSVANQITLFATLFHLSSLIGAPFSGFITDRFGRKPVIIIASTLFFLGALWQSLAGLLNPSFAWTSVLLGRCLGGIGNGFILTVMPVYASELAPASYRGKVVTIFQLFITIGIVIMAGVNKGIENSVWGWRLGIALQCIPCLIIITLTLLVLPESPRFLVMRGNTDEARSALRRLAKGTANRDQVVEFEMEEMQEEVDEVKAIGKASFLDLFKGTALPATMCGVMVAFSQNVTGVNWFMNYATVLFSSLGFQPFVFDLILKSINMLATIAALGVVDRMGRKYLTVWGTTFVILVFFLITVTIYGTGVDVTAANPDSQTKAVQIFCVAMIFFFQIVFAICWGTVGWIVPAESWGIRLRGVGMSTAVVANMATNIMLGDYGFQAMSSSSLELAGTTLVALIFNVVIVLNVVVFLQPETKGVSMEEMRYVFAYEKGGNPELDHGTLSSFFGRNFRQALQIFRCRTADTRLGFPVVKAIAKP